MAKRGYTLSATVGKKIRSSKTRPKKVRDVYFELRKSLGESTSSYEVIQLSRALVDLFEDRQNMFFVPDPLGKPSFEQLPLDKAFEDGGWRVLDREATWVGELLDDESRTRPMTSGLNPISMGYAA